jgi:N-acetylmuramoyl-L-alanine amidase
MQSCPARGGLARRFTILWWTLAWLALMPTGLCSPPPAASGDAIGARFFEAETCQRQLAADTARQAYRHHWLRCIEQFNAVYSAAPEGKWAPAALYRAGALYLDLARRSGMAADRQEGSDRLQRVLRRFPSSAYKPRAALLLADSGTPETGPAAPSAARLETPPKAVPKAAPKTAEDPQGRRLLQSAERCHAQLQKNPRRTKHRDVWMGCIQKYQAVVRHDPAGPLAAQALYMVGRLHRELAGYSFLEADRRAATDALQQAALGFAGSLYGRRAQEDLALMGVATSSGPAPAFRPDAVPDAAPGAGGAGKPADSVATLIARQTEPAPVAAVDPPGGAGAPAVVNGLRFWSNPNYTRVVVDVDNVTEYRHHLLKKDPEIGKPQRLFVDLAGSRLGKDLQRQIPINDDLLLDARAGQYDSDTVRVVVDIKSFKTYKLFSLRNPFRIVLDIWGDGAAPDAPMAQGPPPPPDGPPPAASGRVPVPDAGKLPAGALAKQLALGVRRIVIDPGHGGKDFGAPGHLKGIHEKHVVLDISKRLAARIRQRLGCEVIMTRDADRYLTLEERTAIANTRNADLFISVHTNAARDQRAHGIETFFLNLATDNDAILVAARENATSEKNISDLQTILLDLMQNAKINESSRLAGYVQTSLHGHLQGRYSQIRSKGVKQAPFYVLLGAQMPAILVETSFISNERECRRLIDPKYQEHICEGIVNGIEAYIRETNPTALIPNGPRRG